MKLTEGFIYSINVSIFIISDMGFIRWRVFNSKCGLGKGNLVLIIIMKRRMCSTINNNIWLIFENQVNTGGAIFLANISRFIYEMLEPVNSCGSFKLSSFNCCNIIMPPLFTSCIKSPSSSVR